jgi:hypothetical protein
MKPDYAQAREFLKLVDPAAKQFTFQTFDDDVERADRSLARILHLSGFTGDLLKLYEAGTGVWLTINATDFRGRKTDNITRIRAVWCEDDEGFEGAFPLEPSLVVETSEGHFHRYWLVDGDWPTDAEGKADFAGVMRRMVADYGSDKNAKDLARMLRVPGFLHRKDPGNPQPVRIVGGNRGRYARVDILRAFPPLEEPLHVNGHANGRMHHSGDEDAERLREGTAVSTETKAARSRRSRGADQHRQGRPASARRPTG